MQIAIAQRPASIGKCNKFNSGNQRLSMYLFLVGNSQLLLTTTIEVSQFTATSQKHDLVCPQYITYKLYIVATPASPERILKGTL